MLLRLRSGKMHQFTLQNRFYNGNVSTSKIAEHQSVYITPAFYCPMSPRLSEHTELKQSCRLQGLRACSCSVRTLSKLKNKTNQECFLLRDCLYQTLNYRAIVLESSCGCARKLLVPGAGSTGAAVQSAVQGGCSSSMQHCSSLQSTSTTRTPLHAAALRALCQF